MAVVIGFAESGVVAAVESVASTTVVVVAVEFAGSPVVSVTESTTYSAEPVVEWVIN